MNYRWLITYLADEKKERMIIETIDLDIKSVYDKWASHSIDRGVKLIEIQRIK